MVYFDFVQLVFAIGKKIRDDRRRDWRTGNYMADIQLIGLWYSGTIRDLALVSDCLQRRGHNVVITAIRDFSMMGRFAGRLRRILGKTVPNSRLQ